MIYNVPDPPRGSKITVEPDAYELRLSWGGRRSTGRLVLDVAAAIVGAALAMVMPLFLGSSRPEVWALSGTVVLALVGFAVSVVVGRRALAPETVRLGLDRLVHTAGGRRSAAAAPGDYSLRRRRVEIRRSDLRDLVTRTGDGKAFVALACGKDTRDIGWGLATEDREWLVSILRRWKEPPG